MLDEVWVFNGTNARFPGGVFAEKAVAENWIKMNNLTAVLTLYPINQGVYDWAISKKFFIPRTDAHQTPAFIQRFSSASQEHFHYLNGLPEE